MTLWEKLVAATNRAVDTFHRREAAKVKVTKLLALAEDQKGLPEGDLARAKAEILADRYAIRIPLPGGA